MTSDAIRQPGEPARPAPDTEPGSASAEEAAADTQAADTEVAAAEAASAELVATADAVTSAETVTTAEAVAATQAAAADAPAAGPRRRDRAAVFMRRFAVFAVAVAFLVGGIVLGSVIFQRARPAADVVPAGQVGITAEQPALVAQEFIAALRANDFDGMRSSMQGEAVIHFGDEIERRGVMTIDKVEVLGTHVSGQRSATEILMHYKNDQDLPLAINLVILVDGGKIEGFR